MGSKTTETQKRNSAKRLTATKVRQEKPDSSKRRELPDDGCPGLYLVIQPSGRKSWAHRDRFDGKPFKLTLGSVDTSEPEENGDKPRGPRPEPAIGGHLTLAEARKLANDIRHDIAMGINPVEKHQKTKRHAADESSDQDLVSVVLNDFLRRHVRVKNRASWAAEVQRIIDREVRPGWGKRRVTEITRRDVIELLDSIVDRGNGQRRGVTANRTLAVLRKFFNWCIGRGVLESSPCRRVEPPVPELSRDRVLSADEIRWFWRACDAVGYPFGAIGKLCLLTGQRRDEVGEMTMDELDLPGHLWAFSRDRAKNDERQAVPLSSAALAVIESLPTDKPTRKARKVTDGPAKRYLFTTTGSTPVSGWSRAKANLDGLMLDYARQESSGRGDEPDAVTIEHWTMHDLRRTADTGMARLGVLPHVIDKVMNHRNGAISGVRAVYNRYDYAPETRQALEQWGRYVLALVEGKGEVQPLRAAE